MKIECFITAVDEVDILPWILKYYNEQGIDVTLIDCTKIGDHTIAALGLGAKYPNINYRCLNEYNSFTEILQFKQQLMMESDADWIINSDADEFLYPPRYWSDVTLDSWIHMLDERYNAIDFRVFTFSPIDNLWEFHNTEPGNSFIYNRINPEQYFRHYEPIDEHYNLNHIRVFKKCSEYIDLIPWHSHTPIFLDYGKEVKLNIYPTKGILKHYPYRTQEQAERKVKRVLALQDPKDPKEWHSHIRNLGYDPEKNPVTATEAILSEVRKHNFIKDPKDLVKWK